MAEVEFLSGFKNRTDSISSPGDMIDLDMTEYLRDYDSGAVFDYDFFTQQTNNTYFYCPRVYVKPGRTAQDPEVLTVPGFYKVKITRAVLHSEYNANTRYTPYNVKIGTDANNKTWYLFADFWFTGKDSGITGSINHMNYAFGLRNGPDHASATEYKIIRTEDTGTLNPGTYEPFFMAGCGYVRIPDTVTTVPEDRRYVLAIFCWVERPSSSSPWPYYPTPCSIYWTSTVGRSTGGASITKEMNGNPNSSVQALTYFGFVDVPKMISSLSLTPELEYIDGVSPEVGPESEEGGSGVDGDDPTFDDTSDTIDIPTDPTLGVSNVGFVRVYNTGVQSLIDLGVELFPPLAYTNPTPISGSASTTDAIIDGFNSLITFFANVPSFFDQIMANTLINYVIDCHIIPVNPGAGTTEAIKVGYKTLQATGGRIYSDYVNVSCGSIYIGGYYANFADYLTTAKLYLPFVGFVPVRPEWFQNDTLKVDYKFNIIDGSFTAYVRSGGRFVNNGDSTGTIVGQYGGNACIHLPITGVTYSNMVSGLVGAGAGMAVGAASGNIAAAATSAIGAAGVHGDIAQSNAYTGSAAFLGCRYPFLMIERPVSSYARNYQHEIGLPSNIYARLSQVSGFVKMENVHVDGITGATDEEKEEIRKLLASGVIV